MPTSTPSQKKQVLIVEDEKPIAHALELKLIREGFDVHLAPTGKQGLEEALGGKYDLIVTDLMLPEVDGFAILKELKEKKSKTPVVVLSNLAQEEDHKKVLELGAAGHYVKFNISLEEVVRHIREILSK